MAPGYVFQVSLRFTIQNQIRISQRVIVDEIIQLRPLRHGHVQCILFLLEQFLISPNERTEDYNRRIIDTFVNHIEITDTEMLIYFNLSEASASAKTKKFPVEQLFDWESSGPSGENRTHGLLNPIQARYQNCATPGYRPPPPYRSIGDKRYYTHLSGFCQHFSASFSDFFKKSMIFVV